MKITGLHHVTAIASDPRRNVQFYTAVLGLRLVKKTVNFDDPTTYHLYYGDHIGSPGTILTFFPWSGLQRGRPGTGQVYATAFAVAPEALPFWEQRLHAHGVALSPRETRFGEDVLGFSDPDGLRLELVGTATRGPGRAPHAIADIPAEYAIRGFHGVTIAVRSPIATEHVLTTLMKYDVFRSEGSRARFTVPGETAGAFVDLWEDSALPNGLSGAGTVHHVAFRTPEDTTQREAQATLLDAAMNVSPVMDRKYFRSIYFREPGGVLFEIATDTPGFAVDETVETLGSALKLPEQYEAQRAKIVATLPSLT